jgi:tRNA pseudouridine55 synthase
MPVKSGHISGLLNINKPKGITSHDVVARVRKLTGQRKVGHAGTLDPMATGVLLLCLGQATRLIEYLVASRKQYQATICFGVTTDTLDAEGQITATNDPSSLTESHLQELLPKFLGKIEQTPPIFSALKKDGQPIYKRARAGQKVEVSPRRVTIDSLTWVTWHPPYLTLNVACSSGTYIRSLARDLGEAAGTGAHLAQLTRTASGNWSLADAVSLDQLEREAKVDRFAWKKYLHPLDQTVAHLPAVTLTEEATTDVQHGRQVQIDTLKTKPSTTEDTQVELVRAYTPSGDFLAILTRAKSNDNLWQPKKVFRPEENSLLRAYD